jgi:hypothetical protein
VTAIRALWIGAVALSAAGSAAACADGTGATASGSPAAQEALGIVTSIQGSSPAQVSSFTLRTESGEVLTFDVGRVALAADSFPPGHLHDHLASAQPVRVSYISEGGRLIATRLRDGP